MAVGLILTEVYGYYGEIRDADHVVSGFVVSPREPTITTMLTAVEYALFALVGLSMLAIFIYICLFFVAVLVGLFGRPHDPLAEELDQFLDDLLGPDASPWREPERMHGRRHR